MGIETEEGKDRRKHVGLTRSKIHLCLDSWQSSFPWNRMILSRLKVLSDQHTGIDFLEIEKFRVPLYTTYSVNKNSKILAKIFEKWNFTKNFLSHLLSYHTLNEKSKILDRIIKKLNFQTNFFCHFFTHHILLMKNRKF